MSVAKGMDSANFGDYGNIAIVTMKDIDTDSEVYQKAKNSLISNANLLVSASEKSAYRLSVTNYYKGGWGSNMTACNQGIIILEMRIFLPATANISMRQNQILTICLVKIRWVSATIQVTEQFRQNIRITDHPLHRIRL